MAKRDARATILETADRLFYAEGIRAVGVDRLISQSGIAKATFYKHFPSKDALILAYIEARLRHLIAWLDETLSAHFKDTKARPLAAMGLLTHRFKTIDDRGCPFAAVLAEFRDPSEPQHKAAVQAKILMRVWLEERLKAAGFGRDAHRLALDLMILYDGAAMMQTYDRNNDPGQHAMDQARRLLSQGLDLKAAG